MKKISAFMIIFGLLIAAAPIVGQYYTAYTEEKIINQWLDSGRNEDDTSVETSSLENTYAQLERTLVSTAVYSKAAGAETGKKKGGLSKQVVLGVIRIDNINLKLPIVKGVNPENLRVGIGYIPGTAGFGQPGNTVLAGHRNYAFGRFFNDLDKLAVGDEICIITKDKELKYRLFKKYVVTPDDVSVLRGKKDETILTLITCTPPKTSTHRLILHARLVEKVQSQ